MTDDSGRFGEQDPDLQADLESMKTWSPWGPEEVFHLNIFQKRGTFHPFTCPNHDREGALPLVATTDGWICPGCDYTQDWAWLAMIDAKNWKITDENFSFPPDRGCLCEVQGSAGNWHIVAWNKDCEMHQQLEGTHLDPAVQPRHGTQSVLAQRPLHMVGEDGLQAVMKLVGDPEDPNPEFKDAVKQLRYQFDGAGFNTKTLTITVGVREDAPDHAAAHIMQTVTGVVRNALAYATGDGLFEGLIKYDIQEGE